MPRVKKYPIIGGPLHGLFANSKDFWQAGQFTQYADQYISFNSADGRGISPTSMLFMHIEMVPKPMRMPQDP